MAYEDPPEWTGRGAAGRREGWPTRGREGPPRSHRRGPGDDYSETAEQKRLANDGEMIRRAELERQDRMQNLAPPLEPIIHVFERDGRRPVLEVVRDVAVTLACLGWLFVVGMIIQRHGVPLWLP